MIDIERSRLIFDLALLTMNISSNVKLSKRNLAVFLKGAG